MSIAVEPLLAIILVHWVADFVLQTDKMAKGKSSELKWLAYHVGVYSLALLVFFGPMFAVINGALHLVTDAITSRITKRFWAEGRVHDFFVVVGLDQALHMTALVVTYVGVGGWR